MGKVTAHAWRLVEAAAGWVGLVTGLCVQVGLLLGSLIGWCCWLCFMVRWGCWLGSAISSGQAGLQAVFPSRARPLVGFCNSSGLQPVLHTHSWLSGPPGSCRWCFWQCSMFFWGHNLGFRVGQGLGLCSVIRQVHRLCPKFGWGRRLGFTIG